MFILKYFKIMKNSKVARRKENGGQILLKMGFLIPKNSKGWQFLRLESILKPELGKSFIKRGLKKSFSRSKWESRG